MDTNAPQQGELLDLRRSPKKFGKGVLILCSLVSLGLGLTVGFVGGVASTEKGAAFLGEMLSSESAADLRNAKALKRPRFQLNYPGNWKVDKLDDDYDPDLNFSIDSPGSSFANFVIGSGDLDPKDNVEHQREAFLKYMPNMTTKALAGYGQYKGEGIQMKGRILGFPTTVCAYSFRHEGLTFIVVTQCPDEDYKMVGPGLKQIASSLEILKAK